MKTSNLSSLDNLINAKNKALDITVFDIEQSYNLIQPDEVETLRHRVDAIDKNVDILIALANMAKNISNFNKSAARKIKRFTKAFKQIKIINPDQDRLIKTVQDGCDQSWNLIIKMQEQLKFLAKQIHKL